MRLSSREAGSNFFRSGIGILDWSHSPSTAVWTVLGVFKTWEKQAVLGFVLLVYGSIFDPKP